MELSIPELVEHHKHMVDQLREKNRKEQDALKWQMQKLWGTNNECCRQKFRNSESPVVETAMDTLARQRFETSFRMNEQGSLEVGLLWKDRSRPRNNGHQALKIFLGMEGRMKRTPGLWDEFRKTVEDWVDKRYAQLLDLDLKQAGFFIPTFMVIREDKTTTKYRLIVNGKFEFSGQSINDFLISGPNVMNKLSEVLTRFRYHKYVVTCDISNMFLRVKVPEKDCKYLRFLFRNESGKLRVVEMNSHAFGLTQSPFVVMEAVRTKAKESADRWRSASRAVLEDSIVTTYSLVVKIISSCCN